MVTRVIYFILSFMDRNEWLSFLTFAFLPIDEITSVEKETLQISESWVKISFLRSFCIFVGILLDSVDLLNQERIWNSLFHICQWKLESWDLFSRKLEKCLWECLILSLVQEATEVRKLLNLFAILFGSVLALSLETRNGIPDGLLFILKMYFISFQVF